MSSIDSLQSSPTVTRVAARRTRMLERRLDHARSRTVELEAERSAQQRDALAAEMRAQRNARTHSLELEAVPASPAR